MKKYLKNQLKMNKEIKVIHMDKQAKHLMLQIKQTNKQKTTRWC